jgi:phosphatidylserine/phosphatidylglycerophosphate/cardiolipin synthase-like enzyme
LGVIGSSNFTGAGLTANLELNAILKQQSATDALKQWYEAVWEKSEDYKKELLRLLTEFTNALHRKSDGATRRNGRART